MNRQVNGYQNPEGLSNYFTTTLHLRPGETAEVQLALHPVLAIPLNASRVAIPVTPAAIEVASA